MKTIKIIFLALACLIITTNLGMAISPEKQKNQNEKNELLTKIRKSVSRVYFTNYVEVGKNEMIIVRCTINENNRVVVSEVIGFNEKLKRIIRKKMDKKVIKASSGMVGEELALRFTFVKKKNN